MNAWQKFFVGFVAILLIFWTALFVAGQKYSTLNDVYSLLVSVIPLTAGVVALARAYRGRSNDLIRKGTLCIGLGMLLWGLGGLVWSYYNFFRDILIPYPSAADFFFLPSTFLYFIGAGYIISAITADPRKGERKMFLRIALGIFFAFTLSTAIFILTQRAGSTEGIVVPFMVTVLDVLYAFGDFLGLALFAAVSGLSFKYVMDMPRIGSIAILLGLALMCIGDNVFSYTQLVGSYYNGGPSDLVFTIGTFLLSFGVVGFPSTRTASSGRDVYIFEYLGY